MKENVISVKLNSFTKDKIRNLINLAHKNIASNKNFAIECLNKAEYYIMNQYNMNEVFHGGLADIFGYGTGCPLKHALNRNYHDLIVIFFIKMGINPVYKENSDNEFFDFVETQ